MDVQSRGRLYTSQRQRERLGIEGYGHGVSVSVGLLTVERDCEWGTYGQLVTFQQELGTYGEIRVPVSVRDKLNLSVGDTCRVTVTRVE